jgi:RimJ/RimL family protein N-acetyltransferase
MAAAPEAGPMWLITLDGRVIGDCGTTGAPNDSGGVEIGYGLAEGCRGSGYATEAMRAVCNWLMAREDVSSIAAESQADNLASRRVLEKLGFVVRAEVDGRVAYVLVIP